MRVTSWMRGYEIVTFDGHTWVYADDGSPADDSRPCIKCGRVPTPEGHDACLGTIPGVKFACCGHGVTNAYTMEVNEL